MMNKTNVIVIGGGASGMIAAGFAAKFGANVMLLEKNNKIGEKLLMTGKGRCNITNAAFEQKDLTTIFGKNGKFLYSSFNEFDVDATLDFFHSLGLDTKVERGNRVFPTSDNAYDVVRTLENFLYRNNVKIKTNAFVSDIVVENNKIKKVILLDDEMAADKYIIATGGLSYPSTGSTGEGFKWAKKLGHTIVPLKPALSPLKLKESWIKNLQGLSLKNVTIRVVDYPKIEYFGEALFTHNGISGPIILDMSKSVDELLQKQEVKLAIDFKPALDEQTLDKRIQRDFIENINKSFKNSLDELLPKTLIPEIIRLSNIPPDKKVNEITKQERLKLIDLLKNFIVTVHSVIGFEKAVITAGGVSLKEVDPKTMQSKIIDNLFFAGEILDLDAPTGGYNLQEAWTTGFVAGKSVNRRQEIGDSMEEIGGSGD